MKKFYESRADAGKKFEIIAFHDAKAGSLTQLEGELEKRKIRERFWDGEDLPFPVFLDKSGETIRKFAVEAFPTTILIDPKGRLVGEAFRTDLLELALAGILPPVRESRARKPSPAELADAGWQALSRVASDRGTFTMLAALRKPEDLRQLLRSRTFNPAAVYFPPRVCSAFLQNFDKLWRAAQQAKRKSSLVYSEELRAKFSAGELHEFEQSDLSEKEQKEVEETKAAVDTSSQGLLRQLFRRQALISRLMMKHGWGVLCTGDKIYCAKEEDLPKTQLARKKARSARHELIRALVAWFRERNALDAAEEETLAKRFAWYMDKR